MKPFKKTTQKIRVPIDFELRYIKLFGNSKKYEKFLKYIQTPHKKTFRINTIKVKDQDIKHILEELNNINITFIENSHVKNSYFIIEAPEDIDYFEINSVKNGLIYVQDASSMLVTQHLEIPKTIDSNFKLLDLCASPGSKTSQIIELMNNGGNVVANDVNFKRLEELKTNILKIGGENITFLHSDARIFSYESKFDRILVDAPCSGSGILRKNKNAIKIYQTSNIKKIQQNQIKILKNAFKYLKDDGILVYSTCSLEPEENELCVQEILNANKDVKLLEINMDKIEKTEIPLSWNKNSFSKEVSEKTFRIHPQKEYFEGFFIAKFKKIK